MNVLNSPIVLLLLSNVDSQWLRIIVQNNATIETDRLLQLLHRLEFNIAESFELIRFLVLHQTHVLHRELAENLNHVALYDSLRQISDKGQKGRLCWQLLLALVVVVEPANRLITMTAIVERPSSVLEKPRWIFLCEADEHRGNGRRRRKKLKHGN